MIWYDIIYDIWYMTLMIPHRKVFLIKWPCSCSYSRLKRPRVGSLPVHPELPLIMNFVTFVRNIWTDKTSTYSFPNEMTVFRLIFTNRTPRSWFTSCSPRWRWSWTPPTTRSTGPTCPARYTTEINHLCLNYLTLSKKIDVQ